MNPDQRTTGLAAPQPDPDSSRPEPDPWQRMLVDAGPGVIPVANGSQFGRQQLNRSNVLWTRDRQALDGDVTLRCASSVLATKAHIPHC